MSLTPGTRIGSYEIAAQIGVGGMGEVYRATDAHLKRQVAIKVLPEMVAADPDRLVRFQREAEVLASLNHSNIAAIYGLEKSEGTTALVMELVEGPTLADRVAQGPIPVDEALGIAKQITGALEAAHEQGIIHRDLKPANVKVRADGMVKVLDFGLAKAMEPVFAQGASAGHALSMSPTITTPAMTQAGLILGTAAYMSPEQARGRPLDRRADIWAFGCVLYEMVTGRRLFGGEDVTETLASIVKEQPDLGGVPHELRRLLGACLQKDPRQRLRDIGDAWALLEPTPAGASVATRSFGRARLPWLVAGVAILVAMVVSIVRPGDEAPPGEVVRFEMSAPSSTASVFATLSPDGRHLALTLDGRLWIRSFDALQAVPIDGTDGATYPFWSPDSASLAFFGGGMLKRVNRSGGLVQPLAAAPDGRGGAWSPNGTIVFSANLGESGLSAVPATGGEVRVVTTLPETAGEADAHRYPQFLPDGDRFLYLHLASDDDVAGVYVGSLAETPPRRVLGERAQVVYTALPERAGAGYLIFRRGANLMAQAFDVGELQPAGAAFPIVERVGATAGNTGFSGFSVSLTGSLAYAPDQVLNLELSWVDREGNPLGARTVSGQIASFAVSPTEERVALGIRDDPDISEDIWLQNLAGGGPSKFTFGPSPGWNIPAWSPDGDWLAYSTFDLAGLAAYEIRRKSVSRPDVEETLLTSNANLRVWDWAPDASYLVYEERDDLLVLPIGEDATPTPFLDTGARKSYASVSPDGRWMAYVSDEQGDPQVFVRSIPASNALWQVSESGGTMPRWRRDGRELFYRAPDGVLTAVEVGPNAARDGGAAAFDYDPTPTRLFGGIMSAVTARFTYQPSADGERFAVLRPAPGAESALVVVQHWHEELRRLAPKD